VSLAKRRARVHVLGSRRAPTSLGEAHRLLLVAAMRISMLGPSTVLLLGCTAGAGLHMGGSSSTTAGASGGGGGGGASTSSGGGGDSVVASSKPKLDDFSWELQQYTGRYSSAFVTARLTTFKVSPTCWKKMQDKDASPLHTASFYTSDILEYAKKQTGDDWSDIEGQNREKNVKLIEPMVDEFAKRFMVTVSVEGDDCDVSHGSLWLKYWYAVGTAVKDYPPTSGRVFVTLNVTPSVKDITAEVTDDTHIVITASRDIEPRAWDEKIEKPFKRLNR
jgi:hypothetical protein